MAMRPLAWFKRLQALHRPHRRGRGRRAHARPKLALELLEDRTLLSGTPFALAVPLPFNGYGAAQVSHVLSSAGQADTYAITISAAHGSGELVANVFTTSGTLLPRLTLGGPQGDMLIQSDSGRIVQFLVPGDYTLAVSARTGAGGYQLTTMFTAASEPLAPLAAGIVTRSVAIGDLNGDGANDVAAANFLDGTVSVLLNNGDGTIRPQQVVAVGPGPASVTLADVNGDGRLDLLTPNKFNASVSVLLGNGDGTFGPENEFTVGRRPGGVAVADLNGDGKPDLAVSNYRDATVSVLLGNGDGTFNSEQTFATDAGPGKVAAADVNGDGIPDLITPNYAGADVSVLVGNGDGTFQPQQTFATGRTAYAVAVADINGDGRADLAVSNYVDNDVSVLLGDGGKLGSPSRTASFAPQQTFATGTEPYSVALADVNGDGRPDLVTSNFGDNTVSVLLGRGEGSFGAGEVFPAGKNPRIVALGDLDGDGRPDIVTANVGDNNVSVLLGRGDGTFAFQQAAPAPARGMRPFAVAVADLNRDGLPDIVTANKGDNSVSVLLGNRNGLLQIRETFPTGANPNSIAVADVNGDGVPDLVTANYTDSSVSVLVGLGDGTFASPRNFAVGNTTYAVAIADVNGDGRPDIIAANKGDTTVSVLLGLGDGNFLPHQAFAVGPGVDAVAIGDLNRDGKPDIVTANFGDGTLSVLLGNGAGTFLPQRILVVGSQPSAVQVADVNGDGQPDLVAANYGDNSVSVLLGNGDGSFQPPEALACGANPDAVAAGDFNHDGRLDLATANFGSGSASVLLGNGDGRFQPSRDVPAGSGAAALTIADVNGDGNADLAVSNRSGGTVSLILGKGDGSFQPQRTLGLGKDRYSVAVADVNGDGKPDVLTTSLRQSAVTVQFGNGNGTFAPGPPVAVGAQPTSVRIADLNGDSRPDMVATASADNAVSVVLGNGDGTFRVEKSFSVGKSPRAVQIADVNGDGVLDLIAANYDAASVSILLGRGDGSLGPQQVFAVGQKPYSLAVADVNGDGRADLVVANAADDTVSVLLNTGALQPSALFTVPQTLATGRQPLAVTIADVNGDGKADVVTANAFDNTLSVLLGNGDGTFRAQQVVAAGTQPLSVSAADVNGDGKLDFITADYGDNATSVLLGNGDGSFQASQPLSGTLLPVAAVAADVNGDGRPDLVSVGNHDAALGVLVGKGGGAFQPGTPATAVDLRDTPLRADLDGDGIPDTIVLDRSGSILFRKGLASATHGFAPPLVLNPGRPARDIARVHVGLGVAIAAADTHFDPALSSSEFVFSFSLYTIGQDGAVSRSTAFSTTALPTRLAAADLTGPLPSPSFANGLDALIAANTLDNSVTIAVQTAPGVFAAPITVGTGVAPSAIAVTDVNGDGRLDVVVTDRASGDVAVILNDRAHAFRQSLRFRAALGTNGLDTTAQAPAIRSLAQPVSVAAADFTGDGRTDLVVVNAGAHSFSVLANNGDGFTDPGVARTTLTSDGFAVNRRPGAAVTGDFNRDGLPDLAVLMEDTGQLWIYTASGNGAFRHRFTISVGDEATGLSVTPGSAPGLLDLLVGNGFGDILRLEGKGDGTFQISGKRVSLAVVPDLLGPGQPGVLVGNQQSNQVTLQAPMSGGDQFAPVQSLAAVDAGAQLAPGAVQWAVLDKQTSLPDAVVVSSGSNAVIVYRTIAVGNGAVSFAPAPQIYFVGTAPAGLTVTDVNSDGIPDMLVANQGSNDISVLFGRFDADGHWFAVPGPRLKSGGDGPIASTVRDMNADGIPDLVAVNGGSGTITMLPGVGQGFFDDQDTRTLFRLGSAIAEAPTFVGGTSVGYAVTAAGDLVRFDLTNPAAGARAVFTGEGVLTASALESGDVVVALAGGAVKVLTPQGDSLGVAAELRSQAGVPALSSAIEVLKTSTGQIEALVSSQGSDTIFVFAASAAANTPLGGAGPPPVRGEAPAPASPSQDLGVLASLGAGSAIGIALTATAPTAATTGSASASAAVSAGPALTGFISLEGNVSSTVSAALVPVQGNTYATVAILDFGSQTEDAPNPAARRPGLSVSYPVGDTSPLSRFIMGLDDAVRQYRGGADWRFPPAADPPLDDPWRDDVFRRPPLPRPPRPDREEKPEESADRADAAGVEIAGGRVVPVRAGAPPVAPLAALIAVFAGMALGRPVNVTSPDESARNPRNRRKKR